MNITFDQKLQDYMAKKGYVALSVEVVSPIGACADTSELLIGFVRQRDVETVRAKALLTLPTNLGELFVLTRGVDMEENVHLRLRSFFGAKDVVAEGMSAFKI